MESSLVMMASASGNAAIAVNIANSKNITKLFNVLPS